MLKNVHKVTTAMRTDIPSSQFTVVWVMKINI